MGLIKSAHAPPSLSPFSLADIEQHAKRILLRAEQQAEQFLAAAQAEAEAMKTQAHAEGLEEGHHAGLEQGLQEGRKAGHDEALDECRAEFREAIESLMTASALLDASRADLESFALAEVACLAIAIARRVTKRQGLLEPDVLIANLSEAMKLVISSTDVRVAIHPSQRATFEEALPKLQMQWPRLLHVQLIEDPSLDSGGCRVFTNQGQIDADLNGQLDRIAAEHSFRLLAKEPLKYLADQLETVEGSMPFRVAGTVQAITGLAIEASDLALPLGSLCRISSFGGKTCAAEVIGFRENRTLLMPLAATSGVTRGDRIENTATSPRIWCSRQLLGRVLDGFGQPIDGKGPLPMSQSRRIDATAPAALDRSNIRQPISTSIRAIDGLHTCGLGQRMGIFAGPGVGKSVLISSIAKHTSADVSIVALIGERGREVQEFLQNSLGEVGLSRSVMIVSTGDEPPLLRVRAAKVACTVAEYFRDQGLDVLLIMDSLTRLCHAQRQIGLAAHEPPATKGFPPSVFALLPEILERAGKTAVGSITGFYTVLVEGDDFNEPIPDAVKGIADGHFWLSRALAVRGHYPAIDVTQSISRVRGDVCDKDHVRAAQRLLSLHATYNSIEELVNIGAYVPGVNSEYDLAVQTRPKILAYLQQDSAAPSKLADARKQLLDLVTWIDQMEKVIRAQIAGKIAPAKAAK